MQGSGKGCEHGTIRERLFARPDAQSFWDGFRSNIRGDRRQSTRPRGSPVSRRPGRGRRWALHVCSASHALQTVRAEIVYAAAQGQMTT